MQDAVLELVAEGPDYGYSIVKFLEPEWSSAAVYKALSRLLERGLIEPTDVDGPARRPRKHYRATVAGQEANAAHLARRIDARDDDLMGLLRLEPQRLTAALDTYEAQILAEIGATRVRSDDPVEELAAKGREMFNEARLKWIALVRGRIGSGADLA